MAVSIIGDGATITFATSNFSAYVDSISWTGYSREAVDMSHLGTTGGMPFTPSDMYDPGSLQISGHYDPSLTTPVEGAAETITVTVNAQTFVVSGFLTSFDWQLEKRAKATFNATFKITGDAG